MRQNYTLSGEKQHNPLKTSSLLLDTLAQLGTEDKKKGQNPLKKRALSKYFTNEIIFPLIDLSSPLNKAYWSTFHCSNVLLQEGKKITGKYCNNRWCLVCNRIRTAKLIIGYMPVIKSEFKDPFFVTLTVPNVSSEDLSLTIDGMIKTINRINNKFRHRRDFRLKGIRKIECTHSDHGDFHPHLHILIEGKREADELLNAWLESYPEADPRGQDIRPADSNSLIELFKYSTKITAKSKHDSEALDTIFRALYRKRIFQPIGLKKVSVSEDIEAIASQEIECIKPSVEVWSWEHEVRDWLNASGEFLTYYTEIEEKGGKSPAEGTAISPPYPIKQATI